MLVHNHNTTILGRSKSLMESPVPMTQISAEFQNAPSSNRKGPFNPPD